MVMAVADQNARHCLAGFERYVNVCRRKQPGPAFEHNVLDLATRSAHGPGDCDFQIRRRFERLAQRLPQRLDTLVPELFPLLP
jgi:hypothetical protein